jgi:hypothetical protein
VCASSSSQAELSITQIDFTNSLGQAPEYENGVAPVSLATLALFRASNKPEIGGLGNCLLPSLLLSPAMRLSNGDLLFGESFFWSRRVPTPVSAAVGTPRLQQ